MRLVTARDELFLTAVRVLSDESVATACLFAYTMPEDQTRPFLVTNAHVVESCPNAQLFFLQADDEGRPLLGQPYVYDSARFGLSWRPHPAQHIDIAVADFAPVQAQLDARKVNIANRLITDVHAYDDEGVEFPPQIHPWMHLFGVEVDAIEEVLIVGYPSGYFDRTNHLPIVRRGTTATSPLISYGGEPAFVIDAPILPGSSGSPVFIIDGVSGARVQSERSRALFMGIVSEFLPFKEVGKPPRAVSGEADRLRLLTGLGLVYRPSTIREAIEAYVGAA